MNYLSRPIALALILATSVTSIFSATEVVVSGQNAGSSYVESTTCPKPCKPTCEPKCRKPRKCRPKPRCKPKCAPRVKRCPKPCKPKCPKVRRCPKPKCAPKVERCTVGN